MKSRSKELLDRAIAAMVAAIEIYNKPGFPYRTESFAILAINGWELLFKAKWLADNRNRASSLYVYETRENADGKKSKKKYVKRTDAGNPFTHSLSYLAKKLVEDKKVGGFFDGATRAERCRKEFWKRQGFFFRGSPCEPSLSLSGPIRHQRQIGIWQKHFAQSDGEAA